MGLMHPMYNHQVEVEKSQEKEDCILTCCRKET